MKHYLGIPRSTRRGGLDVIVDDGKETRYLDPRFDLENKSPTGFQWGYGGSGPAQLALALLADALEDDERALAIYQRFKFRVIGALEQNKPWQLSHQAIVEVVEQIERERAAS